MSTLRKPKHAGVVRKLCKRSTYLEAGKWVQALIFSRNIRKSVFDRVKSARRVWPILEGIVRTYRLIFSGEQLSTRFPGTMSIYLLRPSQRNKSVSGYHKSLY